MSTWGQWSARRYRVLVAGRAGPAGAYAAVRRPLASASPTSASRSARRRTASTSTVDDIDEKDKNAVWENDYKARHHQKTTQAEDDAAEEARYRQDLDKKQARTDAKAKRKKSLSDVLSESGDEGMKNASRIDTSYHGGGGYVPPQLIQIAGARAMGGLISPGLVPIGPHRPDEAMPMLGPGLICSATSYEVPDGTLAAKHRQRRAVRMSDSRRSGTEEPRRWFDRLMVARAKRWWPRRRAPRRRTIRHTD